MSASKLMDPWSHEQVPILARRLREELNSARKFHNHCTLEQVPLSEALRLIKFSITEGSHFHHWHQSVSPTLVTQAQAAWDRDHPPPAAAVGQQPAAAPVMTGEYLISFYVQLLNDHFKLERESYYQARYATLQQDRRAPTHLLADMEQCRPHLRNVMPDKFAMDFVSKLDKGIREDIRHRLVIEPMDTWYTNLQRIANESNVAWDNYRRVLLMSSKADPAVESGGSSGNEAGPSSSAAASRGSISTRTRQPAAALATGEDGITPELLKAVSLLISAGMHEMASKLVLSATKKEDKQPDV